MSARLLIALLPLTLVAACAGAPDAGSTAAAAGAPPSKLAKATLDGDKMICRRERVVGTHRPQRICISKSDRAALAEKARDDLIRRNAGIDDGGRTSDGGAVGNTAPGN